jgi:hypothetical protein
MRSRATHTPENVVVDGKEVSTFIKAEETAAAEGIAVDVVRASTPTLCAETVESNDRILLQACSRVC